MGWWERLTNKLMWPWVLSHRWERLHYYIDVAVGALSPDGLVGETH